MYLKTQKPGNRFRVTDRHYDGRETTQLANFVEKNDDDVAISKVEIDRRNKNYFSKHLQKISTILKIFVENFVNIEFFFSDTEDIKI